MKKKHNTFQFVSFNERIKKTHVDVVRQYKSFGASQPVDAETFFSETLKDLSDLNGGAHFDNFKKSIPRSELHTYAQILHHQREIAESLIENLKIDDSQCIPALLDLTVALCRDLQGDFYEYFWEFFERIQEILKKSTSENAALIESCFTTYAYLFKLCRRRMVLELDIVLKRLIPLISNKKFYIRRFVAESLAFLIRKCPNYENLIDICLSMVDEDGGLIEGFSDIFFESMKSIRSQLHTLAPKIYSALLQTCLDESDSGFELTKFVTKKLSSSIDSQKLRSIVDVLIEKTEDILKNSIDSNFNSLVNIFQLWIFLADSNSKLNPVLPYIDEISKKILFPILSDRRIVQNSCLKFIFSFVATFWPIRNESDKPAHQISQNENQDFWKKTMQIILKDQCEEIQISLLLEFLERLLENFDEFQSIILSLFVDFTEFYFRRKEFSNEKNSLIRFWAKICNENSSILDENDSKFDSERIFFRYSRKLTEFVDFLHEILSAEIDNDRIINLYSALIVYSNFSRNSTPILNFFCRIFKNYFSSEVSANVCFLMFLTVKCLKEIGTDQKSVEKLPFDLILEQLKIRPVFLPLLNVFYSIVNYFPSIIDQISSNIDLFRILENNFLSPLSSVRMKTMQILSSLEWSTADVKIDQNCFDLALEAESIPLYLDTYRDRLACYRKFGFVEYLRYLPEPADQFRFVPLKFLIGQLNVNFTLLTPILTELIDSHARGQIQNEFWAIFSEILNSVHEKITNCGAPIAIDNRFTDPFWSSIIGQFNVDDERSADYENYRLLLWKSIQYFADLAESKTRYLSDFLLNLARKEMIAIDHNSEIYEDITIADESKSIADVGEDAKRRKLFILRTLVSILNVFSKFNNPKNVSKEKELYRLYFDLLMHGRNDVQQAALECILAYKSKFLTPYRDNLLSLLNDKSFKDNLVLFNIDSDANIVEPEHRGEVMQIVLKLLYGRLLGKGSDSYRKQQIYRFLAGSTNEELKIFLEFMFLPFKIYLDPQVKLNQVCSMISVDYDATKSIPLRKLMGILSHLSTIIKRLGHILIDYRSNLYRICIVSGSILLAINDMKDKIKPYFSKFCKKLRKILTQRFTEFFLHFDAYEFDSDEIRLLFEVGIWPIAENLHKNLGQPSADLIKFSLALSEMPRFFVMLGVYEPSYCNFTLLELLIDRLIDGDCRKSIKNSIGSIVFNLLSLADHEANEANGYNLKIPANFLMKSVEDEANLNVGTKLILPYSTQLLTYLSRIATVNVCRNEKWMKILSVLSEFTKDVTNSERLATILLAIIKSKKIRNVDIQANILISVNKLLVNVENPLQYANSVAELLSIIEDRLSRENLIKIISILAKNRPDLEQIAIILSDINSWTIDRIDEPDFDRIHSGYGSLNKLLADQTQNLDIVGCSFLARNCAYFISNATDHALRDQSADCLRNLIEYSSKHFESNAGKSFLNLHILPLLRAGLKSKAEAIRHEFITILSACVIFWPEHPKLVGLNELTDINDVDLNFFDNIRHIQLHRRSRAIRRICEKLETSTAIRIHVESLFNYVYPIFYAFIFDPTYSKNSNLIDETVRFVAVYCTRATWVRYEAMLRYFLERLRKDVDRQKLMVKIIVAILDSFHFDISGVEEYQKLENQSKSDHQPISTSEHQPISISISEHQPMDVDSVSMASKKVIFDSIVKKFVPELQNCLSKRTSTEFVHRTTAKFVYDEDEEILRVPIALAVVKLLQKLPEKHLESNLPGVLTKVCQMLKSRSWDIRDTTRKILCRIAGSLGSRYSSYIIREMRAILRRGYQLHVLTYSVHVLLNDLSQKLNPGDLEPCLHDVLAICIEDLFGDISKQKETEEITRRLKEARAKKTNATFQILGRLVDLVSLDSVVNSLRDVLERKYSHVFVLKVGEALKYFSQGLICNTGLSTELLMTFVHKLLAANVTAMFEVRKPTVEDDQVAVTRHSCYLIDKEPTRSGAQPKKSRSNNLHIMAAFGLEILHNLLKTKRLEPANQQHCSLLDPFLALFVKFSNAKQPKIVSLSLRCLCWSLQFTLPTMPEHCPTVVQHLFVLLKRFAGVGAASSKGDNLELLTVLFKTITLMIKELDYCNLNANQLRILLQYAEEDLFDSQRQSTAFALIKAILARKLICGEIKSLMRKVEELSIVSQIDTVRVQCRQVICKYLQNYPEGRRPKRAVEFFCAQFEYEYEDGRLSALEMINSFIDFFNADQLNEYCLLIFIHLSLRLINEESPKIKQIESTTIRNLLTKLNPGNLEAVFQMIFEWLRDENVTHKKLAAILLGLTAGLNQSTSINVVLVAMIDQLTYAANNTVLLDDAQVSGKDHAIYLILAALEKYLSSNPTVIRDAKFNLLMNDVWGLIIKFVDHEHVWVRLAACRLIGLMLSHYKPEELFSFDISSGEFLLRNSKSTIKLLCEACLRRFRSVGSSAELSEQVIKNLVFLSRCVRRLATLGSDDGASRATTPTEEDAVAGLMRRQTDLQEMTLERISQQLIRVCRQEVSKYAHQTVKRTNAFKWIAAVCMDSTADELTLLLPIVLPSLHREISVGDADQNLKQLAAEVVELIKTKISINQLSSYFAAIQKNVSEKRMVRKRKMADDAVNRPEMAARRKIRRHKAQIESKKRKFSEKKGKKSINNEKNENFHLNIEDD